MTNNLTAQNAVPSLFDENGDVVTYYSCKADTPKEKARLFNAVNNPQEKLKDFINKRIKVKDVITETIQIEDEKTGEVSPCPRILLIDTNGVVYQAVSKGTANALQRLMQIMGVPTWEDGIEIEVKQEDVKNGTMTTFDVVVDD